MHYFRDALLAVANEAGFNQEQLAAACRISRANMTRMISPRSPKLPSRRQLELILRGASEEFTDRLSLLIGYLRDQAAVGATAGLLETHYQILPVDAPEPDKVMVPPGLKEEFEALAAACSKHKAARELVVNLYDLLVTIAPESIVANAAAPLPADEVLAAEKARRSHSSLPSQAESA